jgi:hypothetical protein
LRSIVVDKTCCEPMPQSKFGQDLKW